MTEAPSIQGGLRHQQGILRVRFALDTGDRTCMVECAQRFPLRTTVPFYLDPVDRGMAFLYVQNPTGGVFAGDRLHQTVRVDAGARVHLTTQSATKLYRMEGGEAREDIDVDVGEGAYLEYIPDPLIPQAGSRFAQHVNVRLAPTGVFVLAETVAPGRLAAGEEFTYDRVLLHTEVRDDRRVLTADRLVLEPGRRHPASRGLLGGRGYLCSVLAVAPQADNEKTADRADRVLAEDTEVFAGAGVLPEGVGVLIRVLAATPLAAQRARHSAWAVVREALRGLSPPTPRK